MNKQNKIILSVVVLLAVVLGITGFLNRGATQEKAELNESAIFKVLVNGEEVASRNMVEIQALGEVDFDANLKTSGKDPIPYTYSGVPLKAILEDAGVDLSDAKGVVVSAVDGYAVSVTMDKILDDDNVYLAFRREGELIGSREEGGKGPYQMIISKDPFSQFWCKYALSADVMK
jgi:DMSO/TMAO reductase YedYZ molybdopterin-dependent catalytic subunit